CDRRLDEEIESIQDTVVYELTRYHEKRVLEYLVQLLQLSFRYQDIETNVMHIYTADIETRMGVPSLHRFNLLCYDLSLSWEEFRELKETIKTTANMRFPQAALVPVPTPVAAMITPSKNKITKGGLRQAQAR